MAEGTIENVEATVREIRRHSRKKYSAEEKVRIALERLRGEVTVFISESSAYRMLNGFDLIESPAFRVMSANDEFKHPTHHVHELWQTDLRLRLDVESLQPETSTVNPCAQFILFATLSQNLIDLNTKCLHSFGETLCDLGTTP